MAMRQVLVGFGAGTLSAVLALVFDLRAGATLGEPEMIKTSVNANEAALSAGAPEMVAAAEAEELEQASAKEMVASIGILPTVVDEATLDAPPLREFERTEPAPPRADVLDPDLYVAALSKQTIIRQAPDLESPIVGFARTGALLRRAPIAAGRKGCAEGWYRVEPDGYICVGKTATLDPEHPIIQLASRQPDRSLPLPYPYGTSRFPTPPLYTKIPSKTEQLQAEGKLAIQPNKSFGQLWNDAAGSAPPPLLANGERVPRPYGYPMLEHDYMTGRALRNSAFAFIDVFEADDRKWGLTADLSILPLDRLEPVRSSEFYGVVLKGAADLPLAFMRVNGQYLYEGTASQGLRPVRVIGYREALRLSGQTLKIGGLTFHKTLDGHLVKDHPKLVTIAARTQLPKWAKDERSWIDISILRQTLVAYRGEDPIFATLVSTGKDGLGDPETTHSTPQGMFLIHTKHVTSTMSGDAADDEYDLRDVPYVQFFKDGYALHAAFWHDTFGQPRSHGCINLSPPDARHLFSVTEPAVPMRWHSALSTRGTLVYIHP